MELATSAAFISSNGFSLEQLAPAGSRPALIVAEGEVNLFLVTPTSDTQMHVGTLRSGGWLRGVAASDAGMTIHAVPSPGTRLVPLTSTDATPDSLCAWISALAGRLANDFPRDLGARAQSLMAPSTTVARGGQVVARREVMWADFGTDAGLLFGQDRVTGLVPLPPGHWVQVDQQCDIAVVNPADALAHPHFDKVLLAFETICLRQLAAVCMLSRVDEINRTKLGAALEQHAHTDVRRRAAKLLGRKLSIAVTTDPGDQPGLFAVAQLVAGQSRTLTRPARLKRDDAARPLTLQEIAQASDLRILPVTLKDQWWTHDAGPLVGTLDDGTPVAMTRDWRGYRIRNESAGVDMRMSAATDAHLARDATAFMLPLPARSVHFPELILFGLRQPWRSVASLAMLTIASAVLAQAIPMATRFAFSTAIPSRLDSALVELGIAIALVAVVAAIVALATQLVKLRTESWAEAGSFAAIWDRLIRLPLAFSQRRAVADIALRGQGAQAAASGIRQNAIIIATNLGFVLSSLGFIYYNHFQAGLIATAIALVELLIAFCSGSLQVRAFATGEKYAGMAESSVLQFTNGISKLRLAGAEDRAFLLWADRFLALRDKVVRARHVVIVHESLLTGLNILWTAALYATILLVATDDQQLDVPLSNVLAVLSSFALMISSNAQLARVIVSLIFIKPVAEFAGQILSEPPDPSSGLVDPGRLQGRIELNALSFRYDPEAPVLIDKLSLVIEPGEFLGIVGRSGSGKTTLAKLLLGLMPADSGSIRMDGHDLQSLDPGSLRRQTGVVLQNGRIMPGTILQAVRGTSGATETEVWAALEAASIAEDVRAMPMGLFTLLTDASRLISGGQAQRLLLARALAQRPSLLILDEATSALDDATQEAAMRAIVELPATRVVIAHRHSTLRHADRILRIEDGGKVSILTFKQLSNGE